MNILQSDRCANCDRAVTAPGQKFCPDCGQPTPAHRIDWHFLGHELEHSVLHMDRGIFYSLKELMLRPGHLMRDYIEGRRANQVKPLLLVMVSAAVVVLLGKYLLEGDLVGAASIQTSAGYVEGAGAGVGGSARAAASVKAAAPLTDWINTHLAVFTLMLLPFEAGAFWLAFKDRGLNYPEWLVISAFLTVQTFIFMAAAVLVQRWLPSAQTWAVLFAFLYLLFSMIQYFQGFSRWKTGLRAFLGFTLFTVITSLIYASAGFVLAYISRQG
ncbi:MAG: DUF3667 domain-containing protein [Pseudoxanthomonas sp.]